MTPWDFISKNKSSLKTAANQRLLEQRYKRCANNEKIKSVEGRKTQLEIDNYKRKVFLLMRQSLLRLYRQKQDEFQFNLYLKRKRTKRIIQKIVAQQIVLRAHENFEKLRQQI